jgi:WD40 repeat protein
MTSEAALALIETILYRSRLNSRLNSLQRTVFRLAWEGCSYGEIARQSGYELSYVKQAGSQLWQLLSRLFEQKVTKYNIQAVLGHYQQNGCFQQNLQQNFQQNNAEPLSASPPTHYDWGDAVDVSHFYGRETELAQLEQWIVSDRCRVVGIFGMGGIGKTSLSLRLAHQFSQPAVQNSPLPFAYILWRSLRNAPPLSDLLTDLIHVLSNQSVANLPETIDQKISLLLVYLRQRRCLIVLDNGETVMQQGDHGGSYLPGYEAYDLLWQRLGQTDHQSTVVLTSREKPKGIAAQEGKALPVRSLRLMGLPPHVGQVLFDVKGDFSATSSEWQQLIKHYAGNPLALKMVAPVIQDLFDGQIGSFLECLQEGTTIFSDIQDLLAQQINRLSVLEQQVMDWLAIARKPITLSQLRANFTPSISLNHLLEALSALERRCLIDKMPPSAGKNQLGFTLQPVVMEYVTERLIQRVCQDLVGQKLLNPTLLKPPASQQSLEKLHPNQPSLSSFLLCSHSLMQAQVKDYVRATQIRLILRPIADQLLSVQSRLAWEQQFRALLDDLRQSALGYSVGYLGGNLINLMRQMGIDLSNWDFSHLMIWNADLRSVSLHGVNFAGADLAKSAFSETFSQVLAVAFSPDGKLLATGDVNHEIHIWQVSDGKPLLSCRVHEGWIWSVAFSPDGKLLATSANRSVHLWDVQSGVRVQTFSGYSDRVFSVAFSPDGQWLATGSEDHLVRIWEVRTGQLLHTLAGHTDEVRSVAFSSMLGCKTTAANLASASYDGTIRLWNVFNGKCVRVLKGHVGWVWSVAFSPDGQTLASGGADGCLRLWQVKTGRCLHTLNGHSQQIRAVAFSPNGRTVASGSDDRSVRLWNYRTGEALKILSGHTSWISSVAFSSDSDLLASGSEDQSVRVWNARSSLCLRTLQGYSNGVWSVAFNPDGSLLASGSQDRMIRLWCPHTGMLLGSLAGHTNWIWSVAFAPQFLMLASGSEDRTIRLWDLRTQKLLQTLEGHQDAVLTVLYSPDGETLWSGSLDGTVKRWHGQTGTCLQTLSGHRGGVWCIALSLDGTLLVSGSQDQSLKVWDAATGQLLSTLTGHQSWIRSVAISPNRETLISGGADGILKIWRLTALGHYCCQETLIAHDGPILSLAFHKEGRSFASSSTDATIKLWNLQTGCSEMLQGHSRWVKGLAYSPDGATLASCGQDETIKLWSLAVNNLHSSHGATTRSSSQLIEAKPVRKSAQATALIDVPVVAAFSQRTLRIPRPYEGMNITSVNGLTLAQQEALKRLGAISD